jgi:hypothetical protein
VISMLYIAGALMVVLIATDLLELKSRKTAR